MPHQSIELNGFNPIGHLIGFHRNDENLVILLDCLPHQARNFWNDQLSFGAQCISNASRNEYRLDSFVVALDWGVIDLSVTRN